MKKFTAILLSSVMILSMAACGKKAEETTEASTGGTESAAETSAEGDGSGSAQMPEYVSAFDLGDISEYVTLGDYRGIEVAAQDTTVTDEEVEEELQSQVENATPIYEEIKEGTVKDGDVVNIDYEGKLDGVAFSGGTDTGFNLTIGSGQFIEGFEDGLIGKNIGETVDLNLSFPDDYSPNPDLADKAVVFTVTINYVQGEEIAQELNDEFVQRNSEDCKTVDEYRAYVKKDLENTKAETAENSKVNEAWDKITENATFLKDAEELITYIYDSQKAQFESSLAMYGMTMETYLSSVGMTEEQFESELTEASKSSAKSQLLIRAIAEAEGMELTDESFDEECEKIAGDLGYTADYLKSNYPEQLLKDIIFQEKIKDFLLETVVVAE